MKRAIISGMWGLDGSGHGIRKPGSLYQQAKEALTTNKAIDKLYVLGKDNARILKDMGYSVALIDSDPVGEIYAGVHFPTQFLWGNKMLLIRQALEDYDEVSWVDFDIVLQKPLPYNYWQQLGMGPPFQFPLTIQRSTKRAASWRHDTPNAKNLVCGGGYMYFRKEERDLIEDNIEIHKNQPRWTGQKTMSKVFDKRNNGWIGVCECLNRGHEISGYWCGFNLFLIPSEKAIWKVGSGHIPEYTVPHRKKILKQLELESNV